MGSVSWYRGLDRLGRQKGRQADSSGIEFRFVPIPNIAIAHYRGFVLVCMVTF